MPDTTSTTAPNAQAAPAPRAPIQLPRRGSARTRQHRRKRQERAVRT